MQFQPPLCQGVLVKRYKRFLADITTPEGEPLTIHCPNTGSMRGCLAPGKPVWYSTTLGTQRKYPHTWELATTPEGDLAGINTHRANKLVLEAINNGLVPQFPAPLSVQAEVKYGTENSRADFKVTTASDEWIVEVKNVTLKEQGCGYFPDAVTDRGTKHLRELAQLAHAGHKTLLLYCVQHSGIDQVAVASHIDQGYARAFHIARGAGMECLALKAQLSDREIVLTHAVPVIEA